MYGLTIGEDSMFFKTFFDFRHQIAGIREMTVSVSASGVRRLAGITSGMPFIGSVNFGKRVHCCFADRTVGGSLPVPINAVCNAFLRFPKAAGLQSALSLGFALLLLAQPVFASGGELALAERGVAGRQEQADGNAGSQPGKENRTNGDNKVYRIHELIFPCILLFTFAFVIGLWTSELIQYLRYHKRLENANYEYRQLYWVHRENIKRKTDSEIAKNEKGSMI